MGEDQAVAQNAPPKDRDSKEFLAWYVQEMGRLMDCLAAFRLEVRSKLVQKALAGWSGWAEMDEVTIRGQLIDHLRRLTRGEADQEVDIANLAMFHWSARCNKGRFWRARP